MLTDDEIVMARVEAVRRLYDALLASDFDGLARLLAPDFVGHAPAGLPLNLGGRHSGPTAMQQEFWARIGRYYEAEVTADEIRVLDDGRMFVRGHYRGRGRESGKRLDAEFIHLLTFDSQARIEALHQLTDTAAWVDALGQASGPLSTIAYSVDDGVATICLDRPEARNAMNLRLGDETLEVARRVADDPAVRAVLICGNGPALSFGGDIDDFFTTPPESYGRLFARLTTPFHEALRVLGGIQAPIVTAAHGAVAGGGLGYVYAADLVIAADNTKFVTAFARLGLSGDGGGTWHLPRLIGSRRAAQAYLRNTPIDAAEALEWGLVNEVVPRNEVRTRAYEVAVELANGPTCAFGRMRALLRDAWTNDFPTHLIAEAEAMRALGSTADVQAAIRAFAAKATPEFRGE
ncbi:enoyl-CoA hydratase-related protein [Mycobacterium sp. 1274756.6]|uniref:enoyl-CoA hydratase-related protein n=1 Tax=Mycobacterium sp. 1274756.6 TaxID=1834076 RepID=UPI0008010B66|nr:enoyl-CoA hydratase-related protein [Mycobacterium sp. 1274756.6]OBJ70672.1 enoyl-CoA hydratase [Mycobacterium sp. 1274756.6]